MNNIAFINDNFVRALFVTAVLSLTNLCFATVFSEGHPESGLDVNRLTVFTNENAIYNGVVEKHFISKNGELFFIGQDDGIKVFDGYRKKELRIEPEQLSYINGWIENDKGHFFVSTESDVYRLTYPQGAFAKLPLNKKGLVVRLIDNNANKLYATDTNGNLFDLHSTDQNLVAKPLNLKLDREVKFIWEENDKIFSLSKTGVYQLSTSQARTFKTQIITEECSSLERVDDMYLFGCKSGLYKYSEDTRIIKIDDFNGIQIDDIWYDGKESIWLGTNLYGALLIDKGFRKKKHLVSDVNNKYSLPSNNIFKIFKDSYENIWFLTDQGQAYYNPEVNIWRHVFKTSENLSNSSISYFAIDNNDQLWAGTHNKGIIVTDFKHHKTIHLPLKNNIKANDAIYSLYQHSDGAMWVGHSSGYSRFDIDTLEIIPTNVEDELKNKIVYSITEDDDETLLGTYNNGLYVINAITGGIKNHVLLDTTINKVYKDHKSKLWLATNRGLFHYDRPQNDYTFYNLHDPNKSTRVEEEFELNTILQVSNTDYWLGTAGKGILAFDNVSGQITRKFSYPEITNEYILGIEKIDPHILFSTNDGFYSWNQNTEKLKRYGYEDGLQSNEFNNAASIQLSQNAAIFGGINGYNVITQDALIEPEKKAKAEIIVKKQQGLLLYSEQITNDKRLIIYQNYFPLQISLKSIDLRIPTKNKIRYKIGKDQQDWIEEGGSFTTSIYSLPRGENQIQLQVAGIGGWSDQIATVTLDVKPAPWLSIYAFIAYTLLAIVMAVLFYQWRINQLKASKRKLEATVEERTKEISDQKQKIEQQYTQLHALANEQTRFFENISHEFRTPLTLILGPINQLREDKLNDKQSQKVSVIERNAKRLLSLIEQLLEISRLNSGLKKLNPVPIELKAYVDELIFEFKAHAESINITIENQLPGNLRIQFDPESLQRILTNLLSNAVKYNKPNGLVEFSITGGGGETEINLVVADTGIGIAEDKLATVFDRFARIENNNQIAGTGIGLSLVKELVDANSATITVASEPNQGSQFTLTLPLAQSEGFVEKPSTADLSNQVALSIPVTSSANDHQPFNSEQRQLLVIDDDQDMLDFVVSELPNYQCLRARGGKEGLAIALEKVPDLIVTDAMMPVMDGFELTTHLKANNVTSHIPVVILTARGSMFGRVEGLKTGADDYLTKPFDGTELNLRVENLLESRDLLKQKFAVSLTDTQASSDTESPQDQFIQKLQSILQAYYFNPDFSVSSLSERMAMSDRQLQRKLKAMAGYSPSEAIRRFRLTQAQQKLRQGQRVQAVCFDVGFNSVPHFSREYKLLFGIAPSLESSSSR